MSNGSTQRAQAHAKHAYFCTCGYVVHGNGAKVAHRAKHQRAKDDHRYMTREWWDAHGQPYLNHPNPERRRPVRAPDSEPTP